jgi:tetratricopeptide (TPR) repeat protein
LVTGGITERQRRGASGESFIEGILKSFAQVMRPVLLDEYALDFYCRLLPSTSNYPSNSCFWVEAKSTKTIGTWRKAIKEKTVMFWLSQVYPVFIIVYDESSDRCYWISAEDTRETWSSKLKNGAKTITLKVNKSHVLQKSKEQNIPFIRKINTDTIRLNAINGIPQFISKGYTGYIPVLKLSAVARTNIRGRIRYGLNYLASDYWLSGDLESAYSTLKLLANFDHGHYDHFLTLARICLQLGKVEEADQNYGIAIDICKSDPNWDKLKHPDEPSINDIIVLIEKERQMLRTKK